MTEKGISVLNVVFHLDVSYGGLAHSVPALCKAISTKPGFRNDLFAVTGRDERTFDSSLDDIYTSFYPLNKCRPYSELALYQRLRDIYIGYDIVHIHGLWQAHCSAGGRSARHGIKPYVVSLHGMLTPWAMSKKPARKALYFRIAERSNLERAACIRALTYQELCDARRMGIRAPVCIIPNGVDIPTPPPPDRLFERMPELRGKRLVTFMSRVLKSKGVDILVSAWANIESRFPDHHLVIAGPDFENTTIQLKALIESVGISDRVSVVGLLSGDAKYGLLAASDVFVLPSASEGLSMAILEAMAAGLPVLATKECNFPAIREQGSGIVVERRVNDIADGLKQLLEMSKRQLRDIGYIGKKFVSERYSWDVVGGQMIDVYNWILGGAKPPTVEI